MMQQGRQHMQVEPEVIAAIAAGQEQLFTLIMSHYAGYAAAVIRTRVRDERDVEELVQDVFAGLWCDIISGRNVERIAGWIRQAAIYKSLEFIRRRARRHRLAAQVSIDADPDDAQAVLDLPDPQPDPARQAVFADTMRQVWFAWANLSGIQRRAYLCWEQGMTGRQTAAACGTSQTNAGTAVYLARQHIRRHLRLIGEAAA